MSRDAHIVIRDFLKSRSMNLITDASLLSEEIIEALEAEDILSVPKDLLWTYASDQTLELELARRKNRKMSDRG